MWTITHNHLVRIILGLLVTGSLITSSCQNQTSSKLKTVVPSEVFTDLQTSTISSPTLKAAQTPTISLPSTPTSTQELAGINFPITGLEIGQFANSKQKFGMISAAGVNAIRNNGVLWSEVEPIKGERRWDTVKTLENGLIDASAAGLDVILVVRSAPDWAQKVPGSSCGPIKEEELQSFALFMKDLVTRYSVPPYNVRYWELGNEPDVAPQGVSSNSVFGCWGDDSDEYYGGGYYAEMLQTVYPVMKAANPEVEVLIGGLLLDCDPINPPEGKDCKPAKFLEGILLGGGGDFFDIISFHGYAHYSGGGGLYNDVHSIPWERRGGVVLGKVDFIREVLSNFGYNKPIMLTEGALLCPEGYTKQCNPPGESFYEAQADYVVWLYLRNWAEGIVGTIWYMFESPGWRHGSMVDENNQAKPVFLALDFLTTELGEARYIQKVTEYPDLQGYEFVTNQKKIWVLWSPDGQSYTIDLPTTVTKVLDVYGNEIALSQGRIAVLRPVYMELNQ